MRSVQDWLDEYGESHRNPTNKTIHWVCVPLIVLSLIALLWELPVPARFPEISPLMNWGTLFMLAALVYYFLLSFSLALGMAVFTGGIILAVHWLDGFAIPLWQIALSIFVLAWIGQFIGHKIEGERPSFFKDIQFLMIGPLWLLAQPYRKLKIPY
jgi:uncharacterized membrane protein YGL010W